MESPRTWSDVAEILRSQRKLARLSLRHLAQITKVSDSYLSQVERGIYTPSPEVLKSIADALNLPLNPLYEQLGWLERDDEPAPPEARTGPDSPPEERVWTVEEAIAADQRLTRQHKDALRQLYKTLVGDA